MLNYGIELAAAECGNLDHHSVIARAIAIKIRTLSPDPDYIGRIRREVWDEAMQIVDGYFHLKGNAFIDKYGDFLIEEVMQAARDKAGKE